MVKITKPQLKNLDGIEIFDARKYFKAQNICSTLSNSTLSSSTLSRPRCTFITRLEYKLRHLLGILKTFIPFLLCIPSQWEKEIGTLTHSTWVKDKSTHQNARAVNKLTRNSYKFKIKMRFYNRCPDRGI